MFTSYYGQISALMDIIIDLSPQSILDIGAGFGTYGFLCREYCDLAQGREEKSQWTTAIEGIEIDPGTSNPVHGYAYNTFHYADACQVVPTLDKRYELALMIDLLGYLPKDAGIKLVHDALSVCDMLLVVISAQSIQKTGYTWMPDDFVLLNTVRTGFLPTDQGKASMVMLMQGR